MWLTLSRALAGSQPDPIPSSPVPDDTTQLVFAIVPDADSSYATVTRWVRTDTGWRAEGTPIPARIGTSGVAWGRGLHAPQQGLQKVEGDNRAPAGVFALGSAYGDAPAPPDAVRWPYHPVGPRDLWFEDPKSPLYNSHLLVPGTDPLTPEQVKAVMKQGDPAHALKVFVAHNAPPNAAPGSGSAIFLHSWRKDGAATTAGCTAMARTDLDALVSWLAPESTPVFALLSAADAEQLSLSWGLPAAKHCFSWVHGAEFSTDCYPTPQACDTARAATDRMSQPCRPTERVVCTTLSASHKTRCFGDMANCERYRTYTSDNGLSSNTCTQR